MKQETIDRLGYLHTDFTLNYLKGNGIKKTEWTEDLADSHKSILVITFDNGTTATITVKNGKATINIDKNGNVKVETTGKYTVKNNTTDLASVISALADEIENLAIVCPNGTGTVDPDSVTSIETWKTDTLKALLDS